MSRAPNMPAFDTRPRDGGRLRRRARSAALGALLTIVALPDAAVGQSLYEAMSIAYDSNPRILSERARLRATDESVPQALAGWRPTLEATGSLGRVRENRNQGAGTDYRTRFTTGIRVTQNLYEGGRTQASIARAEADVLAGRAQLLTVEQEVLLDVATSYLNVVRDREVLRLQIANERRLERQLEATSDRFEVGEVTRTDVAQAESRLARATADRIASEADLEVSNAFYEQVVGQVPGEDLAYPEAEEAGLPATRDESSKLASERNPTVLTTFYERRSAQRSVDQEFADLLPSLDVEGELERARNVAADDRTVKSASVTANVTIPIYQQGSATSEVREARQLVRQANDRIVDARRQAVEDATSAWETLQSSRAQIIAFESEVRATGIALEGVEQEAAVGSRTVLDILDAEQEFLDAQVNLVRARRDVFVDGYSLLSAVGSLTARDLALPLQFYDEQQYYDQVRNLWWGLGEAPEPGVDEPDTVTPAE